MISRCLQHDSTLDWVNYFYCANTLDWVNYLSAPVNTPQNPDQDLFYNNCFWQWSQTYRTNIVQRLCLRIFDLDLDFPTCKTVMTISSVDQLANNIGQTGGQNSGVKSVFCRTVNISLWHIYILYLVESWYEDDLR